MKNSVYVVLSCLAICVSVSCSKKDDSKPAESAKGNAQPATPTPVKVPAPPTEPPAAPAPTGADVSAVSGGMAKLIDRMAAVAEQHKGKCDDQSAALKAEAKLMEADIMGLASQAKTLRAARKLDLTTYKQTVNREAKQPTLRFIAAVEGCKKNAMALVTITIPIFKDDVPKGGPLAVAVPSMFEQVANVAEKHKGKCEEQGEALKAVLAVLKPEVKVLADQTKTARAAGEWNATMFPALMKSDAVVKQSKRFKAAIDGCKKNGLALVGITAPIFGPDVKAGAPK